MADQLKGKRVAALVTHGFEQDELLKPRTALQDAGATVHIVSPESGKVRGWKHREWGDEVNVDRTLDQVKPDDYDALLLPGGVLNPDRLRMDSKAVQFVKRIFDDGKPVAVICHGPWTLVEAGVLKGRTITSWPSVQTDIRNAGGNWVDEEVHVDKGLVSSRKPDDLPAFCKKMVEEFAEGRHRG